MRKIGELKGKPIIEGNPNEIKNNQILYKKNGDVISLSERNGKDINVITGTSSGGSVETYYVKKNSNNSIAFGIATSILAIGFNIDSVILEVSDMSQGSISTTHKYKLNTLMIQNNNFESALTSLKGNINSAVALSFNTLPCTLVSKNVLDENNYTYKVNTFSGELRTRLYNIIDYMNGDDTSMSQEDKDMMVETVLSSLIDENEYNSLVSE